MLGLRIIISIILLVVGQVASAAVDEAFTLNLAPIELIDDAGRQVQLPQPATRIVALAPHIVENLFSAGAGSAIVGTVEYSDYPPEAKTITRIGGFGAHSIEAIVALKPDLVIAWASAGAEKLAKQLAPLNIRVYVSDPHSLADIAHSIRNFGLLVGKPMIAEREAARFLAGVEALRQSYGQGRKLSVFYQVWHEPLQTLNDQHVISEVIRLCGGVNSFGDAKVVAPKLSVESLISRNPDVIVASGMSEARPDWLDNWKAWPLLKAVKNDHLYFVPPDIIQRNTARILDGAKLFCEHLESARSDLAERQKENL